MKNKIALVFPPGWDSLTPPLGISSIKSFLENRYISTKCFDFSIDLNGRFFDGDKNALESKIEDLIEYNPDYIGLTLLYPNFEYSMDMAKKIKEKNKKIKIVVGGPHSSYLREEIIENYDFVDYCIIGEGEMPLLNLLENPKKFYPNKVLKQSYLKDINELPFPNFGDYSINKYPVKMLPISATRGCIKNCTYCGITGNNVSGKYREKKASRVVNEIIKDVEDYNVNNFLFTDALINSNPKLINEICNQIKDSNIDIKWAAEAFPNISKSEIKNYYDSGCRFLWLSPESGSKNTMNKMGKTVDIKKAKDTIKYASESGIFISTWLIIGFPGETDKDRNDSIDFAKHVRDYSQELLFVPFSLMKGSYIYNNPNKFNIKNVERRPCDIWCTYSGENEPTELELVELTISLWEEFNDINMSYPFLDDYSEEEIEYFLQNMNPKKADTLRELIKKIKQKPPYSYGTLYKKIFN